MSSGIPPIKLSAYNYHLPDDKIALFPVDIRDHSKLLVNSSGQISDVKFYDLPKFLPPNSILVANNTKVIPARLWFEKENGQRIQVFLLKPIVPDWSICEVMVGNRKRFKEMDELKLEDDGFELVVAWENRELNRVRLKSTGESVVESIERFGLVPLPPYIDREVQTEDKDKYQAVFAEKKGAVAAPTASLHFTERLVNEISDLGHSWAQLTLHVGAGTFKPVTAETADEHEMHAEQFEITEQLLNTVLDNLNKSVIAIGTTSVRVLESLFYLGCKIHLGEFDEVFVHASDGYRSEFKAIDTRLALEVLRDYIRKNDGYLRGETQIFIVPGFQFRVCTGIITNFHQPQSTLLLLISAFLGDGWIKMYDHALENGYRFLSYGDGSLLLK